MYTPGRFTITVERNDGKHDPIGLQLAVSDARRTMRANGHTPAVIVIVVDAEQRDDARERLLTALK